MINNQEIKYLAKNDYDFEKFVLSLNKSNIQEQIHLKPQFYWVCEKNTTILLTDFIGKLENYDKDWLHIQNLLKIEKRINPYFITIKSKLKKNITL